MQLQLLSHEFEGKEDWFYDRIRHIFCSTVDPLQLSEYLVEQNCLIDTDLVRNIKNKSARYAILSIVFLGVEGVFWCSFHTHISPILSRIVVKEFSYSYSTTVWLNKTFLLKDEHTRQMFNSNRNRMLRLCYWTRITLINRVKVCCWHWSRKITLQIFEVILL